MPETKETVKVYQVETGRVVIDVDGYHLTIIEGKSKLEIIAHGGYPGVQKPSKNELHKAFEIAGAILKEQAQEEENFKICMDFFRNPEEALRKEEMTRLLDPSKKETQEKFAFA